MAFKTVEEYYTEAAEAYGVSVEAYKHLSSKHFHAGEYDHVDVVSVSDALEAIRIDRQARG